MAKNMSEHRKYFSISSSAGVISAVADFITRALIFPIFGIVYNTQTELYPAIGLIMGFITTFLVMYFLKVGVKSAKFRYVAPIVNAVLMPILRLYVLPYVGVVPTLSLLDYIFLGFWDMLLTAQLLKLVDLD